MKKIITVSFCLLMSLSALFAFGKREKEDRDVEKMDSWKETFDINEKKAGKYNIVVTATDIGGNQTLAGPMNIFIDPESDLPICGITNPRQDMSVPGNLNIVGTCVDDDAVERVEIVLDGAEDAPLLCTGKDFWSYYLDTNALAEGPHTLSIYGIDINGVKGHPQNVTWHLNRRAPSTEVSSHTMGMLVSGKQKITGIVTDGNGISALSFSVDGGETFLPIKVELEKKTKNWVFEYQLDTTKIEDGPRVSWFKAVDTMGSVGMYSFLFFVDNTKPDVQIVSPTAEQSVNGKFSVAGFAKDTIGMTSLTWEFNEQTGEIELIPGNPFFTVNFDVRNLSKKDMELKVKGIDTAGNISMLTKKIIIDAASDKSNVTVSAPIADATIFGDISLAGVALDDDGIAEVYYSVDDGTPVTLVTDGAFMDTIPAPTAGKHVLKVWAKDVDDVEGNITTVNFTASGEVPLFDALTLTLGEKAETSTPCVPGMEINPESQPKIKTVAKSDCGIKSLYWQFSGKEPQAVSLKEPVKGSLPVEITLNTMNWGFGEITVTAIDIYDRKTETKLPVYLTNLTKTRGTPEVVFSDSTINEDGLVVFDPTIRTSGYFVGGKAATVKLVPDTRYASVRLENNSIIFTPGTVYGTSEAVKVEVTTSKGIKYQSRPLKFCLPAPAPEILLKDTSVRDGQYTVSVEGSVRTGLAVASLQYRILSPTASGTTQASEWNDVSVSSGNSFSISCPSALIPQQTVSVLEIKVVDTGNTAAANGVVINAVPAIVQPEAGKPIPVPKAVVYWLDGEDVYYAVNYAGPLAENVSLTSNKVAVEADGKNVVLYSRGGRIARTTLNPGDTSLEFSGLTGEAKAKTFSGSYTAKRDGSVKMWIESVNETPYNSGVEVVFSPLGTPEKEVRDSMLIVVESDVAVSEITAKINDGAEIKATLRKNDGGRRFEADLPLVNIPANITKISATAKMEKGSPVTVSGTISVLRAKDASEIVDAEKVYWQQNAEEFYLIDSSNPSFAALNAYGNFKAPFTVEFNTSVNGLSAEVSGSTIIIHGTKEGEYKNVVLKIKDAEGIEYKSDAVSIRVDNSAPVINWAVPETQIWAQKEFKVSGTVTEAVGVVRSAWTVDGGTNWNTLNLSAADATGLRSFDSKIDITNVEDGLVVMQILVTDNAGKTTQLQKVIHKDTVAPEIAVILPEAEATVNGETRIVFDITDVGKVVKAEYVAAPVDGAKEGVRYPIELTPLVTTMIGTKDQPILDNMIFEFTDIAGNVTKKAAWEFKIDAQSDLPVAEIHVPDEMQIIQTDFVISGVVYDDDGEAKIWYKIDNDEFKSLEGYGSSFSIPVPLTSMTDNEHTVTVFAEDIRGVKGTEVVRTFRISLEEPKGQVTQPAVDETVKGVVNLAGVTSDKNGIEKVQVSVDNGNSYITAEGTENWTYSFDTHIIQDGTHVVFLKVWDKYGIQGLYSSLMNIDNTAPNIRLELPIDDSKTSGMLFFSGQTTDNIGLKKLYIRIRNLDKTQEDVPAKLAQIDLVPDDIITRGVDLSELKDGFYNVEVTGEDAGGNISRVSRNIQLDRALSKARVDVLYPLNNEKICGHFNLYGKITSEKKVENIFLYVDGQEIAQAELSLAGYYRFALTPDNLTTGAHKIIVRAMLEGAEVVESAEQILDYSIAGPWIAIDTIGMGDFAVDRPYLKGRAGYNLTDEELAQLASKETDKEIKAALKLKEVEKVDLSFDNGKTFTDLSEEGDWEYRIENGDMPEGYHFMVVRALMKDGERALTRMIVQVDKTAPYIKLISPGNGGKYNQEIVFSGLSSDDVKLKNVNLALRSGDKASYEVPGFIQGLYFDIHGWGATLWDVGMGLTFFDDNVKLQVQYGQFTDEQWGWFETTEPKRYGGNVFGAKLLANIFYLPFSYFAGPDWTWLSASLAVGANFSLFMETQSGSPQMLSAVLVQLEFPRITVAKNRAFRTFSFYTEFQLWFAPTDVDTSGITKEVATFIPHITGGLRFNVF